MKDISVYVITGSGDKVRLVSGIVLKMLEKDDGTCEAIECVRANGEVIVRAVLFDPTGLTYVGATTEGGSMISMMSEGREFELDKNTKEVVIRDADTAKIVAILRKVSASGDGDDEHRSELVYVSPNV